MSDAMKVFFSEPFLAGFIVLVVAKLVAFVAEIVLFRLPNRIVRHFNIMQRGWPPPHCDADGDLPPVQDDDEDEP